MAADHLYKISWQRFRENITENFRDLREANQLHDVSLFIDSHHSIGAHKVILCTVSPYFRRLLTTLPPTAAAHPVLLMPKDVTKVEVGQILDFVYYGEVSLPQSQVQRFLDIAEHFEIRGLKEESKTDPNANRQSSPAIPIEGLTFTSLPKQAQSGLSSTQEIFDPKLTSTPSKAAPLQPPPTSLNQLSTPSIPTSDMNNPEAGHSVIKKEPSDLSEQPCATPQSIKTLDPKSLVRKAQDSDKRAVICDLCGKKIKGGNAEGVRHVVDVHLKHEGWEANNRGVYYSHKKAKSKEKEIQ